MLDNTAALLQKLDCAQSYEEWLHISKQLDDAENRESWRHEDESEYYDSKELTRILRELREARLDHNIPKLLYLVRTTFSRDIGNMGDPRLYTQARSGTKYLIDEFINECELVLETIVNDADLIGNERRVPHAKSFTVASSNSVEGKYHEDTEGEALADKEVDEDHGIAPDDPCVAGDRLAIDEDRKKKLSETLDVLRETRKAFGRTALVFSGGSILGFLHAGVTKELINANLLPNIISGSSSGSIFASIFCTRRGEEFEKAWELLNLPMNIFEKTGNEESFMTHLKRFLTLGTWIDSSYLKELMQQLIGDITFREAFNRTGRILNVTVSVAGSHDMPRLLNYLTAPNVVIWSAVVCSCSVPLVFAADSIWAKDPKTKNIYPWSNGHFIDGSVDNDMPLGRLTEMFNVNHFVACQVNPHIAPLFRDTPVDESVSRHRLGSKRDSKADSTDSSRMSSPENADEYGPESSSEMTEAHTPKKPKVDLGGLYSYSLGSSIHWFQRKLCRGFRLSQSIMLKEVEHGLTIMKESGLGASAATVALNVMNQDYWGDINIVPSIKWSDVGHLFKNPTTEQILDLVHRGQEATWSKIAIIRNHCSVELALDKAIFELNSKLVSIVGAEHQLQRQNHNRYLRQASGSRYSRSQRTPSPHHQSQVEIRRRKTQGFVSPIHWPTSVGSDGSAARSRSVANLASLGNNRRKHERRSSVVNSP